MDIPDPNWPTGSLLEDQPQRTKECGCVFSGWYREGHDRPFKMVFDTWGWAIVSRCSLHQEEYQRHREENIRIQEQHQQARQLRETRAIQLVDAMKNTPMSAIPIQMALTSYRASGLVGNSDKWVLDNRIKTCIPLQAHKSKNRWYVNGNVLDIIDWQLIYEFPRLFQNDVI